MAKTRLADLPAEIDRCYRAGLPLAFIVSRDAGSVVAKLMPSMVEMGRTAWAWGAARPFAFQGALPPGWQGPTQGWGELPDMARLPWPGPTIGIITGMPVTGPEAVQYGDLLDATVGAARAEQAPLTSVIVAGEEPSSEMRHLGPIVHVAPPDQEEREEMLSELAKRNGIDVGPETVTATAEALAGLEVAETRQVALLQLLATGTYDPAEAAQAKAERLASGGLLEIIAPLEGGLEQVGGLQGLKEWLQERRRAYTPEAEAFGLPRPKGVLLVGPPGTGKSLSARAVAASWNFPLVRLDMGRMMGSYVGESEKNLRLALAQAAGMSPAALWVDELEKALSGSGASGSEVTRRMMQTLLTWMVEQDGTFLLATANDVTSLPPELLRKGRLDELFWLDLPTVDERRDILSIHLRRRHRDPDQFDLAGLAAATEGYSGAEIEAAVVDGLHIAFAEGREIATDDILTAIRQTRPLSVLAPEQIAAIRRWGAKHARPAGGEIQREGADAGRLRE